MGPWLEALLRWLDAAPPPAVYAVLGAAATLENLVPPIPADVIVVFGGLLAGRGIVNPWLTFLAVWTCNVLGALVVYFLGRHHGIRFFSGRWGTFLLRPHQLAQLSRFHARFGARVIFISRFLPMFRAIVPIFAGVAGVGLVRTTASIAAASAIWYGALVYVGAALGRNLDQILILVSHTGRWFWAAALVALLAVLLWWWRTR